MTAPGIKPPSSKGPSSKKRPSLGKKPSLAKMGFACTNLKLSPPLCTISSDCLTITCSLAFAGQGVKLKFTINKCDNPVSLTAGVEVPTLNVKWSHKLRTGARIAIPGYSVNLGVIEGGVFLVVKIYPKRGKLALKVRMRTSQILWTTHDSLTFTHQRQEQAGVHLWKELGGDGVRASM